jgi:hypothetical protein
MKALAERRLVQVMRRKPQAGCLVRLLLIDQPPDFKLKYRNSTLATGSPTIKGLCLLKDSDCRQTSIICAPHVHSDNRQSRRK